MKVVRVMSNDGKFGFVYRKGWKDNLWRETVQVNGKETAKKISFARTEELCEFIGKVRKDNICKVTMTLE